MEKWLIGSGCLLGGEWGQLRRWRNFGETKSGVGKVTRWGKKAAISLKRVNVEEKLLGPIGNHERSFDFGSPPYLYFRFHL